MFILELILNIYLYIYIFRIWSFRDC